MDSYPCKACNGRVAVVVADLGQFVVGWSTARPGVCLPCAADLLPQTVGGYVWVHSSGPKREGHSSAKIITDERFPTKPMSFGNAWLVEDRHGWKLRYDAPNGRIAWYEFVAPDGTVVRGGNWWQATA